MKNVLIISTTEEELLSNVDDGTNRLFINGSEIPSTDWVGTGNYTATVEGHAITIAKIDTLTGNISLARTGDYTYEMRSPSPTTIVVDSALSTTSENPVQNKVITNALNDKYAKTGGLINSTSSNTPVQIRGNSDSETWVRYEKKTAGGLLGYIGVKDDNKPHFYNTADHEIALKDEVLPLTGGTIGNGVIDTTLYTKGTATGAFIGYKKNDDSMFGYIGVKSDNKPYFYDSSNHLIQLADDGFTMTSDMTYDPDLKKFTCTRTTTSAWASQVYSKTGYKNNVFVTFKPSQANKYIMMGLDSNPSQSASYDTIDYCFYVEGNGRLQIYENGTSYALPSGHTTYAANDEFRIEYTDGYIRYYHNGVLVRSAARNIGNPLYLDSSFYCGGSLYDVVFGVGIGDGTPVNEAIKTQASGMFNITMSANGVAQVPSQNTPTISGYTCIGYFLSNFYSTQLSASQIPPTCVFYRAGGTAYILGSPNKTYSVEIYGIFIPS